MTTDRVHLERYLQAIEADVMPVDGRFLELAAAHGEALLDRASIVAGQVVMISGGSPPEHNPEGRTRQWPRALVIADDNLQQWRTYAKQTDARLANIDGLAPLSHALNRDIAWASRHGDRTTRRDLTPWLIGAAVVLWLGLFRRRRTS